MNGIFIIYDLLTINSLTYGLKAR